MATVPGSPPLQYGLGYRQAQIGNPQQVLQTPMRPGIARPQQNIQQINQPAAQAQQPPQGGSGSYQALVQALAAQQAGTQADRFRRSSQGAFKQPGLAGAVFGGLHGYLAGRKEKEQMEAQKESLRLQDDDARIEEMQERKAIYDTLKSVNPNLSDEQALSMAKAIQAGHAKLEDFIPEAQTPHDIVREFAALTAIYGSEDEAKKKLATKYESKLDGKGGDETKPFSAIGSEQRVKLGLISSASNLVSNALPVLFDGDEFRNTQSLFPKSGVRIALDDMREGLIQTLRATSGAAIPETEIEREVDSMMPVVTDTDPQARAKINRIESKLRRLHSAMTTGYRGVPPELQLAPMTIGSEKGDSSSELTLEQQAEEAIAQGADPAAVYARLKEMKSGG